MAKISWLSLGLVVSCIISINAVRVQQPPIQGTAKVVRGEFHKINQEYNKKFSNQKRKSQQFFNCSTICDIMLKCVS